MLNWWLTELLQKLEHMFKRKIHPWKSSIAVVGDGTKLERVPFPNQTDLGMREGKE
jgi:hypothetical protein